MSEHPIQKLMSTAMENIKGMIDVNAIVGNAVEAPDGSIIIPISKVGFGFAAGGTEFNVCDKKEQQQQADHQGTYPFGGGSGGGVTISPMAFLIIRNGDIRLLSFDHNAYLLDRMLDLAPELIEKIQNAVNKKTSQV